MVGSLNFVNDLVCSKPVFVTTLAENFASFILSKLSLFKSFKMQNFSSKHGFQTCLAYLLLYSFVPCK